MTWELEWDEDKASQNLAKRGLHFRDAARFDWTTAQVFLDDRYDYGEERFRARGFLDGWLHILVYVLRNDRLRVISLRRANARECKRYAAERPQI
jgi:uncharacterized DUF497 family protein